MRNVPEVDIIMPVYNAAATLPVTLGSIAGQTHGNVRLVCVDDGSTDGSGDVLERFAREAELDVEVIRTPNRGSYAARETGLRRARGAWVGFCDAGDRMHPRAIELLVARAEEDGSDIAVSAFRRVGPAGSRTEMAAFPPVAAIDGESGWLVSVNTALWNKIYRAELVEKRFTISAPPRIGEDALFLMSLYPHAERASFIAEPLYDYRVEGNSNMSSLDLEGLKLMTEAWEQARSRVVGACPPFEEVVDLAAMVHLGVSAPLVMLAASRELAAEGAALAKRSLDASFPSYRESPFVTRPYVAEHPTMRNMRLMHAAVSRNLMPQALAAYGFLRDKLHVNLGW